MRQLVYICSPYRGDRNDLSQVEQNVALGKTYVKDALDRGYIPIAPHIFYHGMYNDLIAEEREIAMDICKNSIDNCSEIWVCGSYISKGMEEEIAYASERDINIVLVNKDIIQKSHMEHRISEPISHLSNSKCL